MILVDASGWHGARLPELRGDKYEKIAAALGPLNPNGDSLVGQVIAVCAEDDLNIIEAIGWLVSGAFISQAESIQLDWLGEFFSLPRFGLTSSSAYVLYLLEPGEEIAAGNTFQINGISGDWTTSATIAESGSTMSGLILSVEESQLVAGNTFTIFISGRPYATQYQDGDTSDEVIARLFATVTEGEDSLATITTENGVLLYVADGQSTTQITYSSEVFTLVRTAMPATAFYQSSEIFPVVMFGYQASEEDILILANGSRGFTIEDDESYRLRIQAAARKGRVNVSASRPGIKNAVLGVPGVTFVDVQNNREISTNSTGVPGKSIQCFVAGGDNDAVAQAIYDAAAGECGFYGDVTGTATDGTTSETVYFSRQSFMLVYVSVYSDSWDAETTGRPDDYEAIALSAVTAYFAQLDVGLDVWAGQIAARIMMAFPTMTGVGVLVGTAPNPTGGNVSVDNGVVAVIDSTSVTVA